ncbi:MAG: VOC family protein [Actinomycetota bacterium]|nr:VOC family protein [Actinomycetota bacterium]
MGLIIDWVAVDAHDPEKLARFWADALDYKIEYDSNQDFENDGSEREVVIAPQTGHGPRLLFLLVMDEKKVKNRLHLDLRPGDQNAEVNRLEQLGARRVDIGQGDVTWVVLADPEGNEFCVLRAQAGDDTSSSRTQADRDITRNS